MSRKQAFMLNTKNAFRIFLSVNLISWLLLLASNLPALLGFGTGPVFHMEFYLKGLLLNFFFLAVFFFFKTYYQDRAEQTNFVELLTNLFVTGLITNTGSLVVQFISTTLDIPPVTETKTQWIDFLYHLNIAFVSIFLTQTFFYWKRMVLHQKSNRLLKLWNTFEYLLLVSLVFNFFEFGLENPPFSIALLGLMIYALILSGNLKWIAYLNAKEKWQSILLLLFIAGFTFYFFRTVIVHYSYDPFLSTDLTHSVYILAIGSFVLFYSIFSILVILFNLPMTSVFERKLEEILSFQKLAKSLQIGEQEEQVYEILLDSAVSTVSADAAWLEILDDRGELIHFICKDIDLDLAKKIKKIQKKYAFNQIVDNTFGTSQRKEDNTKLVEDLKLYDFESIYSVPLVGHDEPLGSLTLLKRFKDGFDIEKQELIKTFVLQTSISIENYRLVAKTVEAERYKEEVKIARTVQKSLLPAKLDLNPHLEISAFSNSAYEVGGDYYDIYSVNKDKLMLIIGDVSGKGTTAAFNMAQMKGVFQALARLELSPEQFLSYANNALGDCFDKFSFITATLLYIDTRQNIMEFSRAGHCPTLYYEKNLQKANYSQGKGLGLGIIRGNKKDSYLKHLETQSKVYKVGDLIVLYTDGIVEAKNAMQEEYGYERLKVVVEAHAEEDTQVICNKMIEDLHAFAKETPLHDDYTAMVIKIKAS